VKAFVMAFHSLFGPNSVLVRRSERRELKAVDDYAAEDEADGDSRQAPRRKSSGLCLFSWLAPNGKKGA